MNSISYCSAWGSASWIIGSRGATSNLSSRCSIFWVVGVSARLQMSRGVATSPTTAKGSWDSVGDPHPGTKLVRSTSKQAESILVLATLLSHTDGKQVFYRCIFGEVLKGRGQFSALPDVDNASFQVVIANFYGVAVIGFQDIGFCFFEAQGIGQVFEVNAAVFANLGGIKVVQSGFDEEESSVASRDCY